LTTGGPRLGAHLLGPGWDRRRSLPSTLAFAVYVGSIVGANWMITHVGTPGPGAHVLPVGFGLRAPSGVYLAAATFVARDIVQRFSGLRIGLAAIVVGASVSLVFSTTLGLASGATFLCSETCDFLVYTPLQARYFPLAVAGSGLVGDLVDSTLFLTLAGIPLSVAWPGQVVGKAWVVLAGGVFAALARRWGPFKLPARPLPATG
jgi:queuosine precursor transporter